MTSALSDFPDGLLRFRSERELSVLMGLSGACSPDG